LICHLVANLWGEPFAPPLMKIILATAVARKLTFVMLLEIPGLDKPEAKRLSKDFTDYIDQASV
jgi:hypothetical protein